MNKQKPSHFGDLQNEDQHFESTLLVAVLYFDNEPQLEDNRINENLTKRFAIFDSDQDVGISENSRHYSFREYLRDYNGSPIPIQGTILQPDTNDRDYNKLEATFQQTWDWEDAESIVRNSPFELLLTDLLSRGHNYKQRLECFQRFVSSIVEASRPSAIWITNGEKLISTQNYLDSTSNEYYGYQNLRSFLNIRLYNLKDSNHEFLMDTVGLHSLGLPDFELRFSNNDPSEVAGLLFNYAQYIYEEGPVIQNGNTIQGLGDNKLTCNHRESLLEPKRLVIAMED